MSRQFILFSALVGEAAGNLRGMDGDLSSKVAGLYFTPLGFESTPGQWWFPCVSADVQDVSGPDYILPAKNPNDSRTIYAIEIDGESPVRGTDAFDKAIVDIKAGNFKSCRWELTNRCIAKFGEWSSCTAYPTAPEVVCFGGFSQTFEDDNRNCEPHNVWHSLSGQHLESNSADQKKIWYSIGGGPAANGTWWTVGHVNDFNEYLKTGVLSNTTYLGVVYDIEVIKEVASGNEKIADAFEDSFKLVQNLGLQVMVTTSYTGPWNSGLPTNYPQSLIGTETEKGPWRQILESKHVDIFSPQFYGDGIVETGRGSPGTLGAISGFKQWQDWIDSKAKIRPIFNIAKNTDTDKEFQDRIKKMSDKCKEGDFVDEKGSPMALWCDPDMKYYLWSAN